VGVAEGPLALWSPTLSEGLVPRARLRATSTQNLAYAERVAQAALRLDAERGYRIVVL